MFWVQNWFRWSSIREMWASIYPLYTHFAFKKRTTVKQIPVGMSFRRGAPLAARAQASRFISWSVVTGEPTSCLQGVASSHLPKSPSKRHRVHFMNNQVVLPHYQWKSPKNQFTWGERTFQTIFPARAFVSGFSASKPENCRNQRSERDKSQTWIHCPFIVCILFAHTDFNHDITWTHEEGRHHIKRKGWKKSLKKIGSLHIKKPAWTHFLTRRNIGHCHHDNSYSTKKGSIDQTVIISRVEKKLLAVIATGNTVEIRKHSRRRIRLEDGEDLAEQRVCLCCTQDTANNTEPIAEKERGIGSSCCSGLKANPEFSSCFFWNVSF